MPCPVCISVARYDRSDILWKSNDHHNVCILWISFFLLSFLDDERYDIGLLAANVPLNNTYRTLVYITVKIYRYSPCDLLVTAKELITTTDLFD